MKRACVAALKKRASSIPYGGTSSHPEFVEVHPELATREEAQELEALSLITGLATSSK